MKLFRPPAPKLRRTPDTTQPPRTNLPNCRIRELPNDASDPAPNISSFFSRNTILPELASPAARNLKRMLRPFAAAAFALCSAALPAQPPAPAAPDADTIMARVAANQDRSEAERAHYTYTQHAHVTTRTGKTIRCEETTDSRVTPTATGSSQQLLKLDGRVLVKHKYVAYNQPMKHAGHGPGDQQGIEVDLDLGDDSFDRELAEDLRNDLTKGKTKDGIGSGLFPLTSNTQAGYSFRLVGREHMNGREVFHVTFAPKDPHDITWKGDAYIDTEAFQPIVVRTAMAHNVPFAVRTLLGTSLPGLGFTVIYAPQKDGIWFPVSFGTEFKLHIFFFFNRQITLSAENRDFEQTHVNSKVVPVESASVPAPQP